MPDLTDRSPMPFGIYGPEPKGRGYMMAQVPADYLDWCSKQPWIGNFPAVKEYIDRTRWAIDAELKKEE